MIARLKKESMCGVPTFIMVGLLQTNIKVPNSEEKKLRLRDKLSLYIKNAVIVVIEKETI